MGAVLKTIFGTGLLNWPHSLIAEKSLHLISRRLKIGSNLDKNLLFLSISIFFQNYSKGKTILLGAVCIQFGARWLATRAKSRAWADWRAKNSLSSSHSHRGPVFIGHNISREGEILRSKGHKSEKFKIWDLSRLEPSVISQNCVIWAAGSLVLLKKSPADVARSDNIFDFSLQISPKMPD